MNPPFPEQTKSIAIPRPYVSDRRGERQSNSCTRSGFAQKFQSSSNSTCAFLNTWYSPVPGTPTIFYYLWVHTLSIIPHNQAENVVLITYLDLNLMRACVPEGIPEQFSRDSTDFILDHRRQASALAFHDHLEAG